MLTLKEASLNWALSHIERLGDTDIFPVPFEYQAIRHDWSSVKEYLLQQNVLEWKVNSHRILLAPKARYGFRVVTQLDPLDFIIFAATIYEMADAIEQGRVSIHSENVYSYRVEKQANGQLFSPNIGYSGFVSKCKEILESDSSIEFVVVTDISDFYPRIYHHRLENALRNTSCSSNHITAVMKLLSGWNGTETFGIPVGNAPSRLLAEITLADIDEALLANQIRFVRYNDDYRIFAENFSEAYRYLAFLADILFRNHGLTLQLQKTNILSSRDFDKRFLETHLERELHSLNKSFDELVYQLDLSDRYEPIDYESLDDDQKIMVDSLNLRGLLLEEINSGKEPDSALVKFVLRRLAQLSDDSVVNDLMSNLSVLHTSFPEIIKYLKELDSLDPFSQLDIGKRLIDAYEDSILSELEYDKMWCLELFSLTKDWGQKEKLVSLFGKARDEVSRQKLILAMGRAGQQHWFQSHWRRFLDFPPWTRRSLLAGASCMPSDARKHWYRSISPQLDILEKAIVKWASQNPF